MVIFKDSGAKIGRVKLSSKQKSQLKLPVYAEPRQIVQFSFDDSHMRFLGKKITKQNAVSLAKWILSHE